MTQNDKIIMFVMGILISLLTIIDKYSNSMLFDKEQDTTGKKIAKVIFLGTIGGFVSLVVGVLYFKFVGNDKEIAFIAAGSAAIFGRDIFYILGNFTKSALKNKTDLKG